MARAWTAAEAEELRILWGVLTTPEIAKRMKRTPIAVALRARRDALGCPDQGTYSLRWFYQEHGYYPALVHLALRHLGLRPVHKKTWRGIRKAKRHWAFSEAEKDQICAFLARREELEAAQRTAKKLAPRRSKAWGRAGEPPACLGCQKTGLCPSRKGYCQGCWPAAEAGAPVVRVRPGRVSVTASPDLLSRLGEEASNQPVGRRTRNALMLDLMEEALEARAASGGRGLAPSR